jgi:hypothetical protein
MILPKSLAILLFLCVQIGLNAQLNQQVEAQIVTNSKGRAALVNVIVINKTTVNKSLSYKLSIVRNEELGEDYQKDDFEERFVLEPGERQVLKQLLLDAKNEPRTIIFVLIYDQGKIIGKDRVVINGLEGEDELKPKIVRSEDILPSDVVGNEVGLMRGIVVEDTKTKPGRDFFKMFYSLYNQNKINGDRIVKVKEELAIGGNTEIVIQVDQDVVVRFFVNPRAGYLEDVAKQSVARVANYFEMKKQLSTQQQRY